MTLAVVASFFFFKILCQNVYFPNKCLVFNQYDGMGSVCLRSIVVAVFVGDKLIVIICQSWSQVSLVKEVLISMRAHSAPQCITAS